LKLLVSKSPWEIYGDPLEASLGWIVSAGYDAVEINLFDRPEPLSEIKTLLRSAGLPVIVQINSRGRTVEEQLRTLEQRYEHALFASPLFFNCHTGRDHFSFEDNLRIFERATELTALHGIPILHETHRGCALFNAPLAVRFLQALPSLRVTADLSHFFCVHESDLSDQEAALDVILARADHIHARVGFAEGPQVSDPRNPLHAADVARSFALWKRIVERARAEGRTTFTVTPEFGPVGYMPMRGSEPVPVADPWEINLWMRDALRRELAD
jgi:sugar phosphate isomerase/epimerase